MLQYVEKAVHLCCVMCAFLYSKTVPTLTFFVLKCKFLLYLYPTIYILYIRKLWMPFKDTVKKVIIAIVIITYTWVTRVFWLLFTVAFGLLSWGY